MCFLVCNNVHSRNNDNVQFAYLILRFASPLSLSEINGHVSNRVGVTLCPCANHSAMLRGPSHLLQPVAEEFLLLADNSRDTKLSAIYWCKLRKRLWRLSVPRFMFWLIPWQALKVVSWLPLLTVSPVVSVCWFVFMCLNLRAKCLLLWCLSDFLLKPISGSNVAVTQAQGKLFGTCPPPNPSAPVPQPTHSSLQPPPCASSHSCFFFLVVAQLALFITLCGQCV